MLVWQYGLYRAFRVSQFTNEWWYEYICPHMAHYGYPARRKQYSPKLHHKYTAETQMIQLNLC